MRGFLTLDYELFMGVSGTPYKCLIEPMRHLQTVICEKGIKITVFVDATYLLRLKELMSGSDMLSKDYQEVANHIKELKGMGHKIQLHIHPQWLYSTYDGQSWHMNKSYYKLDDLSSEQQSETINRCSELLREITGERVTAFRAGGYSIPGNFNDLKNAGISIDSSVQTGQYCISQYQNYDFRYCPQKSEWRFEDNPNVEIENGFFTEYPISIAKESIFHYILRRLRYKYAHTELSKIAWGDGMSINEDNTASGGIDKIKRLMGHRYVVASIDKIDADSLESVYSQQKKKGTKTFVVIGHPKNLSPYSIGKLEIFITKHPEIQWDVM